MTRRRALAAAAAVCMALSLLGWPVPAGAGGGRLSPVQESYEPGDVATLVGYTGGPALAATPPVPFYAYLRPATETGELRPLDTDVLLGPLMREETAHRGFLTLRVSITFDVPEDLDAGEYVVWFCDDPCSRAPLGDLGPSPLAIGVDPARPVAREWAFDDPEIANLAPGALLVGPDLQATAADVRAGRVAPPPEPPPPTPTTVPVPVPTVPAPPDPGPVPTPAAVPAVGEAAPTAGTDWRLPLALMAAAAAGTWLVLARRERSCAPELASRLREAPGAGRSAAADRG